MPSLPLISPNSRHAEMRSAGRAAARLLPDFVGLVFDRLERCTESGADRMTNQ